MDNIERRTRLIVSFLWFSVFFSPLLDLRIFLRFDQIFSILFFALLIRKGWALRLTPCAKKFIVFILLIIVTATLNALTASFIGGRMNFYFVFNWPLKIALNVIIGLLLIDYTDPERIGSLEVTLRILWVCLFLIGLIGIFQVIEFLGKIPNIGINKYLSMFFPYHGDFSEVFLYKTQGLLLKTGGAGRATSTFDGHPILFGDFLTFVLIFLLPFVRKYRYLLIYLIPVLSLFLTLSRGSIAAWILGLFVYLCLIFAYYHVLENQNSVSRAYLRKRFFKFTFHIFLLVVFLFVIIYSSPLGIADPIRVRLVSSLETLQGSGVPEGRITNIWPNALAEMVAAGPVSWWIGVPGGYEGSTDSQYLWLLVNTGIVGILLFWGLHLYLVRLGWKFALEMSKINRANSLFGLSFIAAVISLLFIYVFHPALQGDRLLTTLIVVSILMENSITKIGWSNQRKLTKS
ncbi:MAG: hypothetical protein GX638_05335 [Crenarchaeota archaeon]|nr:hypothetical protein [Thermoproteota archaeon]